MFKPFSCGYIPWFFEYGFSQKKRKSNLKLPVSGYFTQETILFGLEDSVISIPMDFFYEDSFVKLSLASNLDGRTLNIEKEIIVKRDDIPVSEYNEIYMKVKDFERRKEGWVLFISY
jgi:hypothetical protein